MLWVLIRSTSLKKKKEKKNIFLIPPLIWSYDIHTDAQPHLAFRTHLSVYDAATLASRPDIRGLSFCHFCSALALLGPIIE